MKNKLHYLANLLFPAFVFGAVTGTVTSVVVTVFKWCAHHAVEFSKFGYEFIGAHWYLIPVVLVVLFALSYLMTCIYKKAPDLRGGGIPFSVGLLRDVLTFKWLRNAIGVFFLSLLSFLLGVPLGTEGPSVQLGTSLGKGAVCVLARKNKAWSRYSMTGGACAGFSVATGAPVSGILFAIEEAHERVSPMIIIVSMSAVMFATITARLISPVFGVSVSLFPTVQILACSLSDVWLTIMIGILMGLVSVLFLKAYYLLSNFFNKTLKSVSAHYKMFVVMGLTLVAGLFSFSLISTGHGLILSLYEDAFPIYMLIIILIVRMLLTLGANTSGMTGGMFLPVLALGAVSASMLSQIISPMFGLGEEYYTLIMALGITACVSGVLKMPLTSIFFAVEALGCANNVLCVVVVSVISFGFTEIFSVQSINDLALGASVRKENYGKTEKVVETVLTVVEGSFADRKHVRDIFWPAGFYVLSVSNEKGKFSGSGASMLKANDKLFVRYSTYNEERTLGELIDILGEQDYPQQETEKKN